MDLSSRGRPAFAGSTGQFLQVDVSQMGLPPEEQIPPHLRDACRRSVLLRRPFSFAEINPGPEKTLAELLYCAVGPASIRMTTVTAGAALSVVGPLGNGFSVPQGKRTRCWSWGMGAPPIRHCLAKVLRAEHPRPQDCCFVGAKSIKSLPFEGSFEEISPAVDFSIPAFARFGIPSAVATDDGSAGYHGFVTDRLAQWLDEQHDSAPEATMICACGPEAMLAAVARLAGERGIDCQVSMERRMACGIGVCQSCVECRVEARRTVYRLCCQDGPPRRTNGRVTSE
jgi:dihydroorotate dehydrogenase electron transfer subunit